MIVSHRAVTRRVSRRGLMLIAVTISLIVQSAGRALAQADERPADAKPAEPRPAEVRKTFFLSNVTQQMDLGDIQTDLRNMINRAKIYGVASQNAISVEGTEEEVELAQQMISELDRPKKVYRLTYSFTEIDNGRRAGSQQYSLDVMQNEKSELKLGDKVPIVTGTYSHDSASSELQMQYLDVGLHIEAAVVGARLRSHIERSSLSEEKATVSPQDPILRQTVFEGLTLMPQGKPIVLGSIDVPGTTRKEEIAVAAEVVP